VEATDDTLALVTRQHDLVIYAGGSARREVVGYGVAMYCACQEENTRPCRPRALLEENGRLSAGKAILDAETWGLIRGIQMACQVRNLLHPTASERGARRQILVLSDSSEAVSYVTQPKRTGPLACLWN
jgi:hypothetical protein